MIQTIRSFSYFSLFYVGSSLMCWPLVVFVAFALLMLPMTFYWSGDVAHQFYLLAMGVHMPSYDWSLIFLIPLLIISFPFVYRLHEYELYPEQLDVYRFIADSFSTAYGMIGWAITFVLLVAFFSFCLWGVRHVLELSEKKSNTYLTCLAIIASALFLYI